jgi:hypothetical protein
MPTPRHGHCAVTHGGRLYVLGGDIGAPGGTAPLEVYDPGADRWESLARLPEYRLFSEAAVFEDAIYVFGNRADGVVPVLKYDIPKDTWSELPCAGIPIHRSASAVIGTRAYILGGEVTDPPNGLSTTRVRVFDMQAEDWVVPNPPR